MMSQQERATALDVGPDVLKIKWMKEQLSLMIITDVGDGVGQAPTY